MTMTNPAAVVNGFIDEAWNSGRLDSAAHLLDENLIDHDPAQFPGRAPGRDGLLQVAAMIRAAIPDLRRTVDMQIVDGDRVVTSFIDTGKHSGELFGVPATGRNVAVRGINIERVVDGRITEIWHVEDLFGLMAQIGPLPGS